MRGSFGIQGRRRRRGSTRIRCRAGRTSSNTWGPRRSGAIRGSRPSTSLLFETNSLLAGIDSLFPVAGNSLLALRIGSGILAPGWAKEPKWRSFPCTFPADQGSAPRDEFAPDSPHRQLVCVSAVGSPGARVRSRKSRRVAGFWGGRPGDSRPETLGPARQCRRRAQTSLLAIQAVRLRLSIALPEASPTTHVHRTAAVGRPEHA